MDGNLSNLYSSGTSNSSYSFGSRGQLGRLMVAFRSAAEDSVADQQSRVQPACGMAVQAGPRASLAQEPLFACTRSA